MINTQRTCPCLCQSLRPCQKPRRKPRQTSPKTPLDLAKPRKTSRNLTKSRKTSSNLAQHRETSPIINKPRQTSPNLVKPRQTSPNLAKPRQTSRKPEPCQTSAKTTVAKRVPLLAARKFLTSQINSQNHFTIYKSFLIFKTNRDVLSIQ